MSPALAGRFFTIRPPGKSLDFSQSETSLVSPSPLTFFKKTTTETLFTPGTTNFTFFYSNAN